MFAFIFLHLCLLIGFCSPDTFYKRCGSSLCLTYAGDCVKVETSTGMKDICVCKNNKTFGRNCLNRQTEITSRSSWSSFNDMTFAPPDKALLAAYFAKDINECLQICSFHRLGAAGDFCQAVSFGVLNGKGVCEAWQIPPVNSCAQFLKKQQGWSTHYVRDSRFCRGNTGQEGNVIYRPQPPINDLLL